MQWVGFIVTALVSYLLGSIPTGYLVGRVKGIDIRQAGSGNIGATNALRTLGTGAGVLVLGLDGMKGDIACQWAAPLIYNQLVAPTAPDVVMREHLTILAGLAAILGHVFTCWLHFKGGKGIATTAGIYGALAWQAMVMTLALWILVVAVSRYASLASILAAIGLPIMVLLTNGNTLLVILTIIISLIALYKHKGNIQRLLQGTEHRFGHKPSAPSSK